MVEPDGTEGARGRRPRALWAAPLAFAVLVVCLAPWVGELRESVRNAFGLAYLRWVTAGLAVAAGGLLVWTLLRIRERRTVRYGLLAAAALLVTLQVFGWGIGDAEVDTVERVHLLEYGLLAVLLERAFRWRHRDLLLSVLTISAVALVGVADETVQWLTPVRTGDGRDVLLNAWAGVIGYLFAVALLHETGRLRRPNEASRRLAAILGAAVVLAGTAFFDTAHLGHEIHDPRAGSFVSRFTPEELVQEAAVRKVRWAHGRPRQTPLTLEDTFLTEAGWHAQARNEAVKRGDLLVAWRENTLLERWYAPFLDLPGSRWPRPQYRATESAIRRHFKTRQELVDHSPRYRSRVMRNRLTVVPPRNLLWAGAVALALLLVRLALVPRVASDAGKMELP